MSLRSRDVISGKEGRLFLDGEEMAQIKSFEATVEKNKEEVPIMGRRMMGHKTNGASGSGTMTLHKVTSQMVKIMIDYVKTGVDPYFTLQSVLDDKTSGRGTERVTLYEVNFDSAKVAGLDAETAALEEEVPFTFEDLDLPEELRSDFN
ncbi:Phage tail tube protein [Gracilibacillus orientalis]|uniref:Phage tail tube protein n=1 Tax=Gracilibacillus orientalis TaxID=334253 RepID=A0A1I4PMQ3_9BACI|nr:phage tail tube protein [Gracilibacillus orientalis]SFM29151.1 Phage tail tube protein [Gracilibacillus orientalis]